MTGVTEPRLRTRLRSRNVKQRTLTTYSVDDPGNKKRIEGNPAAAETNRRRVGMVVHDDRGMASVEWRDAPAGFERPKLEVLDNPGLSLKQDDVSYDPYSHHTATFPRTSPGTTTRTDLRKLSEWIKKKRELEERRRRGDDGDEKD